MNYYKPLFVILALAILTLVVYSLVKSKSSEKFGGGGGGMGSYQNWYPGINSNNYSEEYYSEEGCGPSIRLKALPKLDNRSYGNAYNEYLNNSYWPWQNDQDRFLGCLNGFMVNCGTNETCYNEAVKECNGT